MTTIKNELLEYISNTKNVKRGMLLTKFDGVSNIDMDIKRLKESNLIDVLKKRGKAHYSISNLGNAHLEAQKRILQKKQEIIKTTINTIQQEQPQGYSKDDAQTQLEVYFSEELETQILQTQQDEKSLKLDLAKIEIFNPELYDFAYEQPKEFLESANEALKLTIDDPLLIRLIDTNAKLKQLASVNRVEKSGQLIVFEGAISTIDKVIPYIKKISWECVSCAQLITSNVDDDGVIRKPFMCACGNKAQFIIQDKTAINRQYITVAEQILSISPEEVNAFVEGDIVNSINPNKRQLLSGNVARFYAIPVIITTESNKQKKASSKVVAEIINYEMVQQTFDDITLTETDIKEIKTFSKTKNLLTNFANSLDDYLVGDEYLPIKQSIVLQLFGGVKKTTKSGHKNSGTIHIALVGDPGKGKTTFQKNIVSFAPKAMYAVGTSSTGKGLMASLDINDITHQRTLRPGPFVRCNGGLIAVDEVDKMEAEDQQYLAEALQDGTFTFAKAGIYAVLDADTSCLLSANPKGLQFNPFESIMSQISIPKNIFDRFDLKWMLLDKPSKETDLKLAGNIFNEPEINKSKIDTEFFKKYIAYARNNFSPNFTKLTGARASKFYSDFRNPNNRQDEDPIAATARQAHTLRKLIEASARMRLSNIISIEDVNIGAYLFLESMKQVGFDHETGMFDNLMSTYGVSKSRIDKARNILKIIKQCEKKSKEGIACAEDVFSMCDVQGIDTIFVEDIVKQLLKEGEIMSPRPNYYKVL